MEIFENDFKLKFSNTNSMININIRNEKENIKFMPIHISFKNDFIDYFTNFQDLIAQIKEKKIKIDLEKIYIKSSLTINKSKKFIKYINLKLFKNNKKESKVFYSEKIYVLNAQYYLTKGINNKRINLKPFTSIIKNDYYNLEDMLDLIDNENILNCYNIDNLRYYNSEKGAFQKINNENIQTDYKNIFEIHISGYKNPLLTNIKWSKKYLNEEIIKIKNKINKYSEYLKKYDIIYLFSSPIINDNNYNESESPISYMEEINIIYELMKISGKKYSCKVECINEEKFRNIITLNKTKILHISAHGILENENYSLILENLKKNGQRMDININKLKFILEMNKSNISQMDLVIISTCHSQDFAELFLEYGAKNVIFIHRKTKVVESIILKFTKYFYKKYIEGYSVKDSYEYSIETMKLDKEILNINFKSCCCQHYHESDCFFKDDKYNHNKIHTEKYEKCKCKFIEPNYHNKECEYYKLLKSELYKRKTTFIKEQKNMGIICCCGNSDIEHNEILKIIYKSKNNDYTNISSFKYNAKGKLFINSYIKLYFNKKIFLTAIGRKGLIGRIFYNISNQGNFSIIYGENGLDIIHFTEAICKYLCQRRIIINYKFYSILSEIDFNFMFNIIKTEIKLNKSIEKEKKYIIIVKFDNNNDNNNFDYFVKIYIEYCNHKYQNEPYFIFLFNKKENDDENDEFKSNIKNYLEKISKNKMLNALNNNIFYAGVNKNYFIKFSNHLIEDIRLNDKEKQDLIIKAEYKPSNIQIINELLFKDITKDKIIKMEKLEIPKISLSENNSTNSLYYLLKIMPSGLPDLFLNLIIINYKYIIDYKNLIIKNSENNWNLINNYKSFEIIFNKKDCIELCYICLFKTLKVYTQLIHFFIDKNKERISKKYGNIHYIYNSYSNKDIWRCKIPITIEKTLGKNILKEDFSVRNHKKNIINLISFIINKIEIFRQINKIKNEIDYFLENILMLFPSYFFLQKENEEILKICINFCEKLIKETKDKFSIKRKLFLKYKLLLFLYSIDEDKKGIIDILKSNNIEPDLRAEIMFLKELRQKNINIQILEEIKNMNISKEMKSNIDREIAIIYYKNGQYDDCLKYLKFSSESNNNMQNCRAVLDYCYVLNKKFKDYKFNNYNKNKSKQHYKLIKNIIVSLNLIMQESFHKDIYYEAYNLREEIFNLLEPDIVMLNSNPLQNISKNFNFIINSQYNILRQLKKNIKSHIRIKSYVLNDYNINQVLNEGKGEILIIQSDDFARNDDIILESQKGISYLFSIKNFINNLKQKIINYKVIILCFPNSSLLKKYFDLNHIYYQYLITFEYSYSHNDQNKIIKDFNKISIQFIEDFIKISVVKDKDIENIYQNLIISFEKNNIIDKNFKIKLHPKAKENPFYKRKINGYIKYHEEIEEKEVYLYGSLPLDETIDNIDDYSQNISFKVFNLIEKINHENNVIFYSNKLNKNFYLKICLEAIKFYHRHKTYCELFSIDLEKDKKNKLKSKIRKLNKIWENEKENNEIYQEDTNTKQKACFIFIYNCKWSDLLDINIYSIIKSNSSFVIIYDEEKKLGTNEIYKMKQMENEGENLTNSLKMIKKYSIKGKLDIKLKEITDNILLFNIDNNNGIDVYINNEKINMIKEGKTCKIDYYFKKDGEYAFEIIFNNILTDMNEFFDKCGNIIYLDFSNFNNRNIINMRKLFNKCYNLKKINGINNLMTNQVLNMTAMFQDCQRLEYLDLSNFNTSNVTNMSFMFNKCYNLKEIKGINKLITNKVEDMYAMFSECKKIKDLDLSNFNTSNVTNMSFMFNQCIKLTEIKGINKFNTNNVIEMNSMFQACQSLQHLDLSNFNNINNTNMSGMFNQCNSLKEIKGINKFITNNVIFMDKIFQACKELKYLDLSNFNTSNVINMSFMFNQCNKLKIIKGINKFITNKVQDMNTMFQDCHSLENLDLSNFDTSNVTNMSFMFNQCIKLTEIKGINKFNTNKVKDMNTMFNKCHSLENLDLSSFNTSNVYNMSNMFYDCYNLKSLNLLNFTTKCDKENMFRLHLKNRCNLISNNKEVIKLFNSYSNSYF